MIRKGGAGLQTQQSTSRASPAPLQPLRPLMSNRLRGGLANAPVPRRSLARGQCWLQALGSSTAVGVEVHWGFPPS